MPRFSPPARRMAAFSVLPALLLFVWVTALPWGSAGHRFINTKAVYHLPGEMALFVADSTLFGQHASDADNRKSTDPTEDMKHYIDIDDYPDFVHLPHSYDSVVALYGLSRVQTNGILPWATVWCYDSLVAQLSRGDWTNAVLKASDLGHYVGDGHQPLHVTMNYNGQLSGNNGIHSRYESTMIDGSHYGSSLAIHPDSVRYVSAPLDAVFSYLLRSNSLVDSILAGDSYAKSTSGWSGSGQAPSQYYVALWSELGSMTLDQMQGATLNLADFWYSAWVDAGLISTAGVPPATAGVPSDFRLEQNYPNPFNPSTTISYVLPVGGTVRLSVVALDGREVATLVAGNESAGTHVVRFDAGQQQLASGVYLCVLRLGKFSDVRKMVLLR